MPETLRSFLLSKQYRSPVDFTPEGMDDAERALVRVYECLAQAKTGLERSKWKKSPLPEDIAKEWADLGSAFDEAMDDDLNTAMALGHIFSMVRITNRVLEDKALKASEATRDLLQEFMQRMEGVSGELGLFGQDPNAFLADMRASRCRRMDIDVAKVEEVLAKRAQARKDKDFAASDALRDELKAMHVEVRDTPQGQTWDLVIS